MRSLNKVINNLDLIVLLQRLKNMLAFIFQLKGL